jgi:hypothetical protein
MDLFIVVTLFCCYKYLSVLVSAENQKLLAIIALILTILVAVGYTTLGFRSHN